MTQRFRFAARLLIAACLAGRAVDAQELTPEIAPRGIFARPSNAGHHFDIDWTAMTALDGNVAAEPDIVSDPRGGVGAGAWNSGEATARYVFQGRKLNVRATASGRERYYPSLVRLDALDGGADVALSANLGRRTTLSVWQGVRYQPFYQLNFVTAATTTDSTPFASFAPAQPGSAERLAPQENAAPAVDAPLQVSSVYTYNGGATYSHKIGLRASADVAYAYRRTTLTGGSDPFWSQNVNGTFSRSLTHYSALRFGYGYGQTSGGLFIDDGRHVAGAPLAVVTTHDLDIGIAYSRPLSRTRRTAFSFSTGSGVISDASGSQYRLLLDARLARQLGRTWAATADYHRGATFIEGFTGPAYADTVRMRIGGTVARRWELAATTSGATGHLGLGSSSAGYGTYSQNADVHLVVTRNFAFVAAYGYYHYDFDAAVPMPFGMNRSMNRQTVQIGVSGSLPFVK